MIFGMRQSEVGTIASPKSIGRPQTRTEFGRELEKSAKEVLAHLKGEKTLPIRRTVLRKRWT